MTIELPLFLQGDGAGSAPYSARLTRQLVANVFTEGILGAGSFEVTERGAGANFTVDVAAGVAVVQGDDESNQGKYLAISTATENVTVPAAPGSNSRYDLVVLQINDPQAGGDAGDDATLEVVAGTADAAPTPPTLPDSALLLATLLVTSSHVSIEDSDITDGRVLTTLTHEAQIGSAGAVNDTLIRRSSAGAAAVNFTPTNGTHITNKTYVDGKFPVPTASIADSAVTEAKLATAVLSGAWTNVAYGSGWGAPNAGAAARLQCKKVGNIVYVSGGMHRTGGSGSNIDMGTLPAGFRPPAQWWVAVYGGFDVFIEATGVMTVAALSADVDVYVNVAFPAT